MGKTLEQLFEQKILQMPKEVRGLWLSGLRFCRILGKGVYQAVVWLFLV